MLKGRWERRLLIGKGSSWSCMTHLFHPDEGGAPTDTGGGRRTPRFFRALATVGGADVLRVATAGMSASCRRWCRLCDA